jgi:MFS family permease
MFLFLTLYIQDVLRYSPVQAGVRFLPITLLSFFVAPFAGRLSVRVPVRLLLGAGLLLVSAGLLAMTAITSTSGWTTLIPGFVLAGAGIGMINPPLASTAVGVVHHTRSGMASGINNTFRQVGIATGVAGLGAVFQHDVTHRTTALLREAAHGPEVLAAIGHRLGPALVSGDVRTLVPSLGPRAREALDHAYRAGFTSSLTTIMLIGCLVAMSGAVLALVLVRGSDFVSSTEPAGAPEGAALETGAG